MKPLPTLVWVEWLDSSSSAGWHTAQAAISEAGLVRSVGWLVRKDKDILVLAISFEEDPAVPQNFCSVMSIPRGCIRAWGEIGGIWS